MEQSHLRLVLSVIGYIAASAIIALVSTVYLSAEDYTIYMAYTSVAGVILLGPSTAIEQQSTLIVLRRRNAPGELFLRMFASCAVLTALIALVVVLPIGDWQTRAFGEHKGVIQVVMLAALPGLFFSCIVRGRASGLGAMSAVANSHVVYGATTIVTTMILWQVGTSLLSAILLGQVVGWIAPGVYLRLTLRMREVSLTVNSSSGEIVRQSLLLLVSNLLLLCNVLASQFIFRLNAETLGVDEVAQAQLMVALSCTSCAIALGVLPTLIHQARHQPLVAYLKQPIVSAVLCAGVVIPIGTIVLGRSATRILLNQRTLLSTVDIALISSSATSLVVALVIAAHLLAREGIRRLIVAWSAGLLFLVFMIWVLGTSGVPQLSLAIALGSVGAPALLFVGARFNAGTDLRSRVV